MKRVGITGGTGFVGRHLTALLIRKGYEVVVFTTRVAKKKAKKKLRPLLLLRLGPRSQDAVEAIDRSQMIVVVKPLSILVAVHLYSIILFADAEKACNVFQSRRSKCL